jgi:hypothetical protein
MTPGAYSVDARDVELLERVGAVLRQQAVDCRLDPGWD